jgi:hypothetical protein
MSPLPRRSLSFSLRTLLVLVTLACAWLAWERSVVMERRTVAEELRADQDFTVRTVDEVRSIFHREISSGKLRDAKFASIPRVRNWMGDVPIQAIGYREGDASQAKVAMAKRLFPEAIVRPISNPLPRSQPAPLPTP